MKKTSFIVVTLAAAMILTMFAAVATADKPKAESLFDGKSLDRWEIITCKAKIVQAEDENGKKVPAILIEEGNGILLADKEYGDFILECDFKALNPEMWDSGIYFRCGMPPEGRPWPKQYQVNMRKEQEGSVPGVKETITKDVYKPGKWNHYKLTVIGKSASMEFNGKKVWSIDTIETPKGHLCLQSETPGGGQYLFKNVTIVDLDAAKK